MKIKLVHNWMGNQKGTYVDLVDRVAEELITRGTATKKKAVGRPPKDKMISQAKNK